MSRSWIAYLVVAVSSVGAGVAIAGVPHNEPVDATIEAPVVTDAPAFEPPATMSSSTTTSSTTSSTTVPTTTSVPPTTSTSTTTPTTISTTTLPPPSTSTTTVVPVTTVPLLDRSGLAVLVANGGAAPGEAGDAAGELRQLGYGTVTTTNGLVAVDASVVYARFDLLREGERLALDLGLVDPAPQPIEAAPGVQGGIGDAGLLVYLGRDRR